MNASDLLGSFPQNGKGVIELVRHEEAKRLAGLHDCLEHHTQINAPGTATEAVFSSNPAQRHLVIVVAKNMAGAVSYSALWIDPRVSEERVIQFMGGFSEFVSQAMGKLGVASTVELVAIDKERN
jgi:hypothetical protein